MRAIVLHEQGAPENLTVEDVPVPEPDVGEILIKTEAIAVSFTEAAAGGVGGYLTQLAHGFGAASCCAA